MIFYVSIEVEARNNEYITKDCTVTWSWEPLKEGMFEYGARNSRVGK